MSERVYTTQDKSDWGDGPWQDEPDKVQWKDEETGFPCLAKRNRMGAWCGYVGVPPGHPAFEADYNDVRFENDDEDGWPDVHGGLTYADHCHEGPEAEAICHVPDPGEPDNVWWLGFDCAHSGDLSPRMEADNRRRAEEDIARGGTGYPWLPLAGYDHDVYRDLAYVRREVTRLARQARHEGRRVTCTPLVQAEGD